jgi:hypothetical protein
MKIKILIAALIFTCIAIGWFIVFGKQLLPSLFGGIDNPLPNIEVTSEQTPTSASINGILVSETIAERRPVAIMVENHPDSRPQSGLSEADIVYEAIAEGGITRFLALYQTQESEHIGPIRSARDYYASIANDYGALYVHVGGSDEVLAQLSQGYYKNLVDLNQFFNGGYFERIKTRVAPHNVYTSIATLRSYLRDKKLKETVDLDTGLFKEDSSAQGSAITAARIGIVFSTPNFTVTYTYDQATNTYKRLIANKIDIDASNDKQLTAKTVIVQFVAMQAVAGDDKARNDLVLTGQGQAIIFQDGTITRARWKKTNNEKTQYVDETGNQISFNRGQQWIELVPNDSPSTRVTWKPLTAQ